MPPLEQQRVTTSLFPHEEGGKLEDFKITVSVLRSGPILQFEYALMGDMKHIILPQRNKSSERRDELWQHTCFEAFMTWKGYPGYFELNVSPSGNWNFYSFEGYRSGQRREEKVKEVSHSVAESSSGATLHKVGLNLTEILNGMNSVKLSLGLTAILEKNDGSKTYWAIEHRSSKPDFHIRESFSLEI